MGAVSVISASQSVLNVSQSRLCASQSVSVFSLQQLSSCICLRMYKKYDELDYVEVRFEIDPELLPEFWEEISMNLKDVVRHEIEHLTHGEGFTSNPAKTMDNDEFIRNMIDMELLPKANYFKLEKEIDANLQGMYFRAKKEKRPFGDVINTYLDLQDITPEEKEEILNLWRRRLPALNLPKF